MILGKRSDCHPESERFLPQSDSPRLRTLFRLIISQPQDNPFIVRLCSISMTQRSWFVFSALFCLLLIAPTAAADHEDVNSPVLAVSGGGDTHAGGCGTGDIRICSQGVALSVTGNSTAKNSSAEGKDTFASFNQGTLRPDVQVGIDTWPAIAASGTGHSRGEIVAVSLTGESDGGVIAVSGTCNASGTVAVGGGVFCTDGGIPSVP